MTNATATQGKTVNVPAVVLDKRGPVTTLGKADFIITVDGKPQTIRSLDHGSDVPLTIGLLVDVGRGEGKSPEEETKASEAFLDALLTPASNRPADKAFLLQFGRSAELLQDVTDSHPLLAAGLKEVGTQAPGSSDDDSQDDKKSDDSSARTSPTNSGNNGGYGRNRGGIGGNRGGSQHTRSSGTVLYDALFLASEDVLSKQKGRRALVVLTQGVDRHSKESLKEAIDAAQRSDTVVYAIHLKGDARNVAGANPGGTGSSGYPGYGYPGGYPGYGYPGPPTTGGSNGDGTYTDPDGRKILARICGETGGRMFEAKGKGALDGIFKQIADELHAQYRLSFAAAGDAAAPGYHRVQLTLTTDAGKKYDIQTRDGYFAADAREH